MLCSKLRWVLRHSLGDATSVSTEFFALLHSNRERANAVAIFDDRGVSCHWPDGTVELVTWEELSSVEFQITDAGPFTEDVFLLLHAHDHGCVVPQEAPGFDPLLRRLQELPGFNNEAVIAAMTCTENAVFPCWRRAEQ